MTSPLETFLGYVNAHQDSFVERLAKAVTYTRFEMASICPADSDHLTFAV
jgi:hypothetical protein